MADALALGASGETRGSSNLPLGTPILKAPSNYWRPLILSVLCAHEELNLNLILRRDTLYPLSYGRIIT